MNDRNAKNGLTQEAADGYKIEGAGKHDSLITQYELYPLGEQAVVIRWNGEIGEAMVEIVAAAVHCMESDSCPAIIEYVKSYRTVTVYYDPVDMYRNRAAYMNSGGPPIPKSDVEPGGMSKELVEDDSPYALICLWIRSRLLHGLQDSLCSGAAALQMEARLVPVCFDVEFGPDLPEMALKAHLSVQEAVQLYCSGTYFVHMIGFTYGFPYMGGLPERLAMPRRSQPRLRVAEGTVGVAGTQTGIYPLSSPGGWQLIGRTPLKLFDPMKDRPSLFQAGDRIRFEPISRAEFEALAKESLADNEFEELKAEDSL